MSGLTCLGACSGSYSNLMHMQSLTKSIPTNTNEMRPSANKIVMTTHQPTLVRDMTSIKKKRKEGGRGTQSRYYKLTVVSREEDLYSFDSLLI